jgi:hypothetical protein
LPPDSSKPNLRKTASQIPEPPPDEPTPKRVSRKPPDFDDFEADFAAASKPRKRKQPTESPPEQLETEPPPDNPNPNQRPKRVSRKPPDFDDFEADFAAASKPRKRKQPTELPPEQLERETSPGERKPKPLVKKPADFNGFEADSAPPPKPAKRKQPTELPPAQVDSEPPTPKPKRASRKPAGSGTAADDFEAIPARPEPLPKSGSEPWSKRKASPDLPPDAPSDPFPFVPDLGSDDEYQAPTSKGSRKPAVAKPRKAKSSFAAIAKPPPAANPKPRKEKSSVAAIEKPAHSSARPRKEKSSVAAVEKPPPGAKPPKGTEKPPPKSRKGRDQAPKRPATRPRRVDDFVSDDEVPAADLVEIPRESGPVDDNLPLAQRRSKRVKVRPLKHWIGETVVYRYDEDGVYGFDSVHTPEPPKKK